MGTVKPVSRSALHKVDAALDEQRSELALLRHNLKKLQDELSSLRTNLLRYEDRLETAAVANEGLRATNGRLLQYVAKWPRD